MQGVKEVPSCCGMEAGLLLLLRAGTTTVAAQLLDSMHLLPEAPQRCL